LDILSKQQKFNITTDFISGIVNLCNRKIILKKFQNNSPSFLCSAKVLQEGIDIPLCDAVCFVDTKTSVIDTIQSLSRCLTYDVNKLQAYIILPFIGDNNCIKNDDRTNDLRIIIKNLIECDENVKEFFNSLKQKSIKNSNSQEDTHIEELYFTEDLNNVSVVFNSDIIDKLNSISYDTYSQSRAKVYKKYKSINEYRTNVLIDFDQSIPMYPEKIYKRLGWIDWKDYIGTYNEDVKQQLIKYKVDKCRDITKCVINGQRIRHLIKNKNNTGSIIRIGIYNNNTITCDNIVYPSLNSFAVGTYKIHRPDRVHTVNAWTDCYLEVNGIWILMDDLPIINQNNDNIQSPIRRPIKKQTKITQLE
jgi:hypothetical protein